MSTQILVLTGGDAHERYVVAAFLLSDVDRWLPFWQGKMGSMYPPRAEVWDGDQQVDDVYFPEDVIRLANSVRANVVRPRRHGSRRRVSRRRSSRRRR